VAEERRERLRIGAGCDEDRGAGVPQLVQADRRELGRRPDPLGADGQLGAAEGAPGPPPGRAGMSWSRTARLRAWSRRLRRRRLAVAEPAGGSRPAIDGACGAGRGGPHVGDLGGELRRDGWQWPLIEHDEIEHL
jgi:hypothetical protein